MKKKSAKKKTIPVSRQLIPCKVRASTVRMLGETCQVLMMDPQDFLAIAVGITATAALTLNGVIGGLKIKT